MRARRAARVLLFHPDGRVLLLHFTIPRGDGHYRFWAAPGGAVEGDETDEQAAERELREELGLSATLSGPVHTAAGEFEFERHWNISTDVFFTARWDGTPPSLDGIDRAEREALTAWRWWTVSEIRNSREPIFPDGLPGLLDRLITMGACRT